MPLSPLPIDPLMPELLRRLDAGTKSLVLEAPPGAGKTTRVPRALLEHFSEGEILVLEPRRIAARMAARRVAEELGERVGERVGYSVRFEEASSAKTRIRFMTEAILTRRWLADPTLKGVVAVVLDEFHERHVHTDLALAWLVKLKRERPDLRLIVMSATLDGERVAAFIDAPRLRSEGRSFPVTLSYQEKADDRAVQLKVASAVRTFVHDIERGDALVFLPGAREIRDTMMALEKIASEFNLDVLPLHGELSPEEQDRAIARSSRRKIILSTNVAESSVTIDGVTAVIDSGLVRSARHNIWSGVTKMELVRTSRASSTQRAGRAGRTAPGVCYRLFSKGEFDARPEFDSPELLRTDLAEVQLLLLRANVDAVTFLDPPDPAAWDSARKLLVRLGAVDSGEQKDSLTPLGKRLADLPLPPRAARLFLAGIELGVERRAATLAALLGERDILRTVQFKGGGRGSDHATHESDLLLRLEAVEEAEGGSASVARQLGLDMRVLSSVRKTSERLLRRSRSGGDGREPADDDTRLQKALLLAFPDRVAKRLRAGGRSLALSHSGKAELSEESAVRHAEWMVVVDGEERGGSLLARLVSEIQPEWLIDLFEKEIVETNVVRFDENASRVEAISEMRFGALALLSSPLDASSEAVTECLAKAAFEKGPHHFAEEGTLDAWKARANFVHSVANEISEVTDDELRRALFDLASGKRTFGEMQKTSLLVYLKALRSPSEIGRIERLAPERLTLPSGRSARVEYPAGQSPFVASRLQDFFGLRETPKIGDGKVSLVVHLLAPNQRAVQVTSDLAGFWQKHYPTIRKELMRRYPRHAWPETV